VVDHDEEEPQGTGLGERVWSAQEDFWAGEFGTEYFKRVNTLEADWLLPSNRQLFKSILEEAIRLGGPIESIVELGASAGLNLSAIQQEFPDVTLSAVEINQEAHRELIERGFNAVCASLLTPGLQLRGDLVFTKGVLIHLDPKDHPAAFDALFNMSRKWILVIEYFNPTLISVPYRGHAERLFKTDWAGAMLDRFPSLELADYGFRYSRDPVAPQDDLTWFLLRRRDA